MRKTNKCEICGKRYLYPLSVEKGDLRERICFKCEVSVQIVDATLLALSVRNGVRYENFLEDYLIWKKKQNENIRGEVSIGYIYTSTKKPI